VETGRAQAFYWIVSEKLAEEASDSVGFPGKVAISKHVRVRATDHTATEVQGVLTAVSGTGVFGVGSRTVGVRVLHDGMFGR
jgi:hypothetical protein